MESLRFTNQTFRVKVKFRVRVRVMVRVRALKFATL